MPRYLAELTGERRHLISQRLRDLVMAGYVERIHTGCTNSRRVGIERPSDPPPEIPARTKHRGSLEPLPGPMLVLDVPLSLSLETFSHLFRCLGGEYPGNVLRIGSPDAPAQCPPIVSSSCLCAFRNPWNSSEMRTDLLSW